jgi:hypothetical protein
MERGTLISSEPVIAQKGTLVGDYSIYSELRKASIESRWDYADEMRKLYRRLDVMSERFMGRIQTPEFSGEIPPVVLAIDDLRNKNTLAAYNLVDDEYGLSYKITMNEVHYENAGEEGRRWRFGEWAQSETLCHELFHHKQQLLGKDPFTPRSRVTHNKEFTQMLEDVGLHCAPEGFHYKVADVDSPFGLLMRQWGIEPPAEDVREREFKIHWFKDGKREKGRSTLTKYECPQCGLKVRYGRKDEPNLMHVPCGELLVRG